MILFFIAWFFFRRVLFVQNVNKKYLHAKNVLKTHLDMFWHVCINDSSQVFQQNPAGMVFMNSLSAFFWPTEILYTSNWPSQLMNQLESIQMLRKSVKNRINLQMFFFNCVGVWCVCFSHVEKSFSLSVCVYEIQVQRQNLFLMVTKFCWVARKKNETTSTKRRKNTNSYW